jgi:maleylacetate reductase
MQAFVHELLSGRVVFGVGSIDRVAAEAARLEAKRVLLIGGGHEQTYAEHIAADLGATLAGRIERVVQHVPSEAADDAVCRADTVDADLLLTIGGGSAVGLAKAVALRCKLPILAVPTTYAGSEMTTIWGLTENGAKTTGRDARVLPRVVVYDPMTTLSMPAHLTATSGMNALAHAVEALYAPEVSPLVALAATETVRVLARALPLLVSSPQDVDARSEALYGAFLAGMSLGNAAMGIHHKICHVLGGAYNLPHGYVHAALLPYAVAYNRAAAPSAMRRIAASLDVDDAARGLLALGRAIGAPTDLAQVGFDRADIGDVARIVAEAVFPNPAAVTEASVRGLLEAATSGELPDEGQHGLLRGAHDHDAH